MTHQTNKGVKPKRRKNFVKWMEYTQASTKHTSLEFATARGIERLELTR